MVPYILESLHRAGMKKDQIRFIWALGAHGVYDMINARKKLGDEIVENYAVYNHDPVTVSTRDIKNGEWVRIHYLENKRWKK